MNKLKELREKGASLVAEAEKINNQALTEKRSLSADEDGKINELYDLIQANNKEVRTQERMSEIQAEIRRPADTNDPAGETKEERNNREMKVFRKYLSVGKEGMTAEERSLLTFQNPDESEKRAATAQTVTTTAGGYLVPTILENVLIKALKLYGGVREAADVFQTDGGYPLDFPTIDDTSNKGRLLGINTQVTTNALVFGKTTFSAYKFSSDQILIPTELLQDEKVDLNAYLADLLGERIGRIENDYMTTGTGSSQPEGCQYSATIGVESATKDTITKANLIDIMHSVDPLYRKSPKCAWMFNDSTAKLIFKLSLGTTLDVPVFTGTPGVDGNTQPMGSKMFGFPYFINPSMDSFGTLANRPVLFGDFSRFKVRDVAGFRMLRLTERYADYDQIAVICLHRSDSRYVTSGAVKYMWNGNT